jgi:predicted nicotinamide N-methyase
VDLETVYNGPTEVSELSLGGRIIRIVRPSDPDRLLNDSSILDLNRQDDYMPYWAYLWPGAYLLAEAIGRESWPGVAEALEIGCGLGLAGLSALLAGLPRVHFTDYDEGPLRFVTQSVAENHLSPDRYTTRRLDWRTLPNERYQVILGADVLYEKRLVPLVSHLIHTMLSPDGYALVAGPYRVATEDLAGTLASLGLKSDAQTVTAPGLNGLTHRGTLHRIWK